MEPHHELSELVLVRHAKSDWGDPSMNDHDRPLNARGNRDAPAMAQRFADTHGPVDVILSSTANRARSTAQEFAAALGLEIIFDPELYLAPAEVLLAKTRAAGAASVMVVAHNPGITDLAYDLSSGEITHMPTCAVARFVWAASPGQVPDPEHPLPLPTECHFERP